jgi:hypothetical protein
MRGTDTLYSLSKECEGTAAPLVTALVDGHVLSALTLPAVERPIPQEWAKPKPT